MAVAKLWMMQNFGGCRIGEDAELWRMQNCGGGRIVEVAECAIVDNGDCGIMVVV